MKQSETYAAAFLKNKKIVKKRKKKGFNTNRTFTAQCDHLKRNSLAKTNAYNLLSGCNFSANILRAVFVLEQKIMPLILPKMTRYTFP